MLKDVSCSDYLRNIIVALLIIQVTSQTDVIDVCDVERMTLNFEGSTGTVVFRGPNSGVKSPCVLRLQAIPSCYISISPANSFQYDSCSRPRVSALCTPGCSYAYVFDGFYYNETLKLISNSNWTNFQTFSSVLYVAVCHTVNTHVDMELKFTVLGRRFLIEGDAYSDKTGEINSTLFPKSYIQNGEQTTFLFTSKILTDRVVLIFDDFNLAPGSALYFSPSKDYPTPLVVTDQSARPIVISNSHMLQFIIDYGWSSSQNEYLGFKATYRFVSEFEHYIKPTTYCGRYYLTLNGGHIEFHPLRFDVPYDCVWVVKTQPGYKGTYMKLDRFSSDYGAKINYGDAKVDIHRGLTSRGKIVGTLIPYSGGIFRDYDDEEGFYIRLRGTFRSTVRFKLAFTSYMDYYASSCNTASHFRCSSGQCIPNQLACDHIEHCKDGTDETIGCSGTDGYNGSDSTLTVSVIIPMVVSIFLLVVLCILFVLVRRCRQARQFNNMMVREPNVSRRRRGRDDYLQRPADAPPTYDEALVTGIPVPDGSYPDDSYDGPPKPPTYSEAISTPLINQSSLPSPPYTSREDLSENQTFLGDGTGLTDNQPGTSFSSAIERPESNGQHPVSTSTQTNRPYNKRVHQRRLKEQPSLHLPNTGQLPSLPSIHAAVGTQSMYNISDIGRVDNMTRTRSEQVLTPKDLNIGIDNHPEGQRTNRQSRLYRGQAVSNLDLPTERNYDSATNSQPKNLNKGIDNDGFVDDQGQMKDSQSGQLKSQAVSNLALPTVKQCIDPEVSKQQGNNRKENNKLGQYGKDTDTSRNKHYINDKQRTARNPLHEDKTKKNKSSAIDRLRPSNPSLSKKFQEELDKRGNKRKDNATTWTDTPPNRKEHPAIEPHSSVRGDNGYLGVQKDGNIHMKNAKSSEKVHAPSSKNPPSRNQRKDHTNHHKSENGFPRNDLSSGRGYPSNNFRSEENRDRPLVHKSNTDIRQLNDSKYINDAIRGSNISLNLSSGNKRQIHQSSMSLNENMLSRVGECAGNTSSRGAHSFDKDGECAGHTSPSLSYMNFNDLSDSVDV